MPALVGDEKWLAYFDARDAGQSATAAARTAGLSKETALRFERGVKGSTGIKAAERLGRDNIAGRVVGKRLDKPAERARTDFAYFRRRYFGRRTVPWQVDAAKKVVAAVEAGELADDPTMMVVNAPPGVGKSTTFTHDIACWLIVRDRTIRIMLGSRTEGQAQKYARRIRNTLASKTPMRASTKDLRNNLAHDADAVLAAEFGEFVPPRDKEVWRAGEFTVLQPGGVLTDEKEATVTAYGQDSGFLGGRFDVVLWDDLVDAKNMRTESGRAEMIEWWDLQAESRVEPGGVFILQGQRISSDDLYRYCLDKKDDTGEPLYQHVVYAAHDDAMCDGHHHRTAPWPNTCLLDPRRLPFKKLAAIKQNNPRVYEVAYQQRNINPEASLIAELWIDGGTDHEAALTYQGCLDTDRMAGQISDICRDGTAWSVVTVDPSPTKWWAVQWWVFHPTTEQRFLVRTVRQKMSSTQLLTMNLDDGSWSGILEDWRAESLEIGVPLDVVIVEQNAAQRFMMQNPMWQRWLDLWSLSLIPHDTHRNKTDPAYGLSMLQQPYRTGLYRLPYADDYATRHATDRLKYELTHYPGVADFDQVMACWFFEHHLAKSWTPRQTHYQLNTPTYLREVGRGIGEPKKQGPRMRFRIGA